MASGFKDHFSVARDHGLLGTWSAVNRHRGALGEDPLPELRRQLARAWGEAPRTVRWDLVVLAVRVGG